MSEDAKLIYDALQAVTIKSGGHKQVRELGRISLSRLTPLDVQGFLNRKHASGLSPRTIQYLHAILRRAFGQAERWQLVSRNVARLVSHPRVHRTEAHPLTPGEVKRLLAAIQEDRLAALYTVSLAVGLRQGEALGLRWQDVNVETGTLTVRVSLQRIGGEPQLVEPKTDRSRSTIRLPDVCVTALIVHREAQTVERAYMEAVSQDAKCLVSTEVDGSPLSRSAVTRRFQLILKNAEIPKRRFHDLRHTCATLLLVQGVPLRVVMETLRYSRMSTTTDIYSHVLPVLMAHAAAKMDAVLTQ